MTTKLSQFSRSKTNTLWRFSALLLIIVGVFCIFYIGCKDSEEELESCIKECLKDNAGISAAEFSTIKTYASDHEIMDQYATDEALKVTINAIAEKMSRRGRNKIDFPIKIETGGVEKSDEEDLSGSFRAHFFYENSGSMDGFLKSNSGSTEFVDAIMNLITKTKISKNKVNLYYINTEVFPVADRMEEFTEYLKPEKMSKVGDRGNSNINNIIKTAADTARRHPNNVSILISDYIYSVKGKNVRSELADQKYQTSLTLDGMPDAGYSVLVIRFKSTFNGNYYTFENESKYVNEERPFFVWIIGKSEIINNFEERIEMQIETLKGYDKHFVLTGDGQNDTPFYTVLLKTEANGDFKKSDRNSDVIHAIEDLGFPRNDAQLEFCVAVDLSDVPVGGDYLLDVANYSIGEPYTDIVAVEKISPIKNIDYKDKRFQGSATHIVKLSLADKPMEGESKLSISLDRKLPSWINQVSTEADDTRSGRNDKTFGFSSLVEGASIPFGYDKKNCTYLTIPITINE